MPMYPHGPIVPATANPINARPQRFVRCDQRFRHSLSWLVLLSWLMKQYFQNGPGSTLSKINTRAPNFACSADAHLQALRIVVPGAQYRAKAAPHKAASSLNHDDGYHDSLLGGGSLLRANVLMLSWFLAFLHGLPVVCSVAFTACSAASSSCPASADNRKRSISKATRACNSTSSAFAVSFSAFSRSSVVRSPA